MELESVLTVGDGNFSFSLSLLEKCTKFSLRLVATAFETEEQVTKCPQTVQNRDKLLTGGATVVYEVDGTKLEESACLQELGLKYDRVIFNFPHTGGKSQIQKNRQLLEDFFKSSSGFIKPTGQVEVALCKGQGGTPADCQKRGFENSWKVVEMAAEAGLVLVGVEPFGNQSYPNYTPTGYRGQEKGFVLDGALVHTFKAPGISKSLFPPVYKHDVSFWCDSAGFDEVKMFGVVKQVTKDNVQSIECIDKYHQKEAAGHSQSYCYRLCYCSLSGVLSRSKARELQLQLRQALCEQVGLEIR